MYFVGRAWVMLETKPSVRGVTANGTGLIIDEYCCTFHILDGLFSPGDPITPPPPPPRLPRFPQRCSLRTCLTISITSNFALVFLVQIVKDAKDGVRDSALMVIVSYDLATRMASKSLLWEGQVSSQLLRSSQTSRSHFLEYRKKRFRASFCQEVR